MFFVIEGIDGAGKSTQVAMLAEALAREGHDVVRVRDPGGTPLSDRIRGLLLHPENAPAPSTELCLYAAARAQLVYEVIAPALAAGKVVVADRFTWSTFAYQGFGRGLPRRGIEDLNSVACGTVRPAHVFVLDLPPETRAERLERKGGTLDRLEREGDDFFQRVRGGFLSLAKEQPETSTVLDASREAEALHEAILKRVRLALSGSRPPLE